MNKFVMTYFSGVEIFVTRLITNQFQIQEQTTNSETKKRGKLNRFPGVLISRGQGRPTRAVHFRVGVRICALFRVYVCHG